MDNTQDNGLGMDNLLVQAATDALQTATENNDGEGLNVLAGLLLTRVLFIQWYTKGQLEACAQALRGTAEANSKKPERRRLRACIEGMTQTALELGKAAEGGITVDGGLTINTAHGLKALARGLSDAAAGGRAQDIENAETRFFGMPLETLWSITDEIAECLIQAAEQENEEKKKKERKKEEARRKKELAISPDASGTRYLDDDLTAVSTDQISKKGLPNIRRGNIGGTCLLTHRHGEKQYNVSYVFSFDENVTYTRPTDFADYRLVSSIATLWRRGYRVFTAKTLYRQFAYGNANTRMKVHQESEKNMIDRIHNLMGILCTIDRSEEITALDMAERKDPETGEPLKGMLTNNVINVQEVYVTGKNGTADIGYKLLACPVIAEYAFQSGKFLTIPNDLLKEVGTMPLAQDLTFALLAEIKRISAAKNKKSEMRKGEGEGGESYLVTYDTIKLYPYKTGIMAFDINGKSHTMENTVSISRPAKKGGNGRKRGGVEMTEEEKKKAREKRVQDQEGYLLGYDGGLFNSIGYAEPYEKYEGGNYTSNALRAQRSAVKLLKTILDKLKKYKYLESYSLKKTIDNVELTLVTRTTKEGEKDIVEKCREVSSKASWIAWRALSKTQKIEKEVNKKCGRK